MKGVDHPQMSSPHLHGTTKKLMQVLRCPSTAGMLGQPKLPNTRQIGSLAGGRVTPQNVEEGTLQEDTIFSPTDPHLLSSSCTLPLRSCSPTSPVLLAIPLQTPMRRGWTLILWDKNGKNNSWGGEDRISSCY